MLLETNVQDARYVRNTEVYNGTAMTREEYERMRAEARKLYPDVELVFAFETTIASTQSWSPIAVYIPMPSRMGLKNSCSG